MVKHNYDEVCWQHFFGVCAGFVSWWSLNCVAVVVCVLVALWWCVQSALTVFGDVLGVLLMSWWCVFGVLAVFRGGVFVVFKEGYFLTKLARLSIPNWRQRIGTRHFAIGVVCWVTSFFCLRSDSV